MLPDTVPPEDVDVVGGEVPDLNDRKGADNVRDKPSEAHKPALRDVQERIVPPDDEYEYQVVDKLKILDLLFGFGWQLHSITSQTDLPAVRL